MKELDGQFNISELADQLESAINSKDPIGYMQNNINWEIDNDLDDEPDTISKSMVNELSFNKSYEAWNPFRKFINWFNRSRTAKKVKKVLCGIADEIKKLIDEEAELAKLISAALAAIALAIGIGAINPMVLTILVGLLATMVLNGVSNVCSI